MVFTHPLINEFETVSIMALQLLGESYFSFPDSTDILFRSEQLENARLSMLVTEFGMSMLVRPEHPLNAQSPMLVTEFGMSIVVRALQPLKAPIPIFVTVFGIVTEVKLLQ